ncbi:MAG: Dam family site-specific DNA-(adenine-N6)-methyltransferase [Planctomycetota bacterium]|nr:Dam family site-specific DNA-(adenine-N6)-methyltransferase [Planctomycetota bacterium]
MNVPHPIPYQGSKRNLADEILRCFPAEIETLHEPFAGSAAISLAAAAHRRAKCFHINDLNKPLVDLWRAIVNTPDKLAIAYEALWNEQLDDPKAFYRKVRDQFNLTGRPDCFLYLLARCVKASVRYNANGEFNQSPDNRRKGATPATMREHIYGASSLLKGRTTFSSRNYRDVVLHACREDLVYMDPPYQGVCGNRDTRYLASVQFCEFVEVLEQLNAKHIRYIVSYDGRTGTRVHGRMLPEDLKLAHMELDAGRSTQATLLGRDEATYESLYLSPALAAELRNRKTIYRFTRSEQMCLWEVGV